MLKRYKQHQSGFTLLETILALSLCVVVMGLITMAMDLHLRRTQQSRVDVERAQLARALLQQISEDIRITVRNSTLDTKSAAELAAGSVSIDPDAIPEELPEDLEGVAETATEGESEEPTDLATSSLPSKTPGLYGQINQLQIDVLKMPRPDELYFAEKNNQPVSDVRTVAYYIGQLNSAESSVIDDESQPITTGLIRRSLSRAATLYATNSGGNTDLDEAAEMLAPEVIELQFRYWDGSDWQESWSSEEQLGVPLAVEIILVINHSLSNPDESSDSGFTNIFAPTEEDEGNVQTYRTVVRLPAARHIDVEESMAPEEEEAEAGEQQ